MRHHKNTKRFGRETDVRRAFMRSLAEGLIEKGRIRTTEARAKALRPFIEKLITHSKKDTVAARRLITERLGTPLRTEKLFKVAPKFKNRPGGYTRIIKVPSRRKDGGKMAIIEFVE